MMKCNDVRQKIDLDDLGLEEMMHIEVCKSCKTYKETSVHANLDNLFSERAYDTALNNVITYKKEKHYLRWVVAALVLFSIVLFDDEILLFAENIPLIGELVELFESDEAVQELKANEIDVYDLSYVKGDYTLFIKDLYLSPSKVMMKFAVSENEQALSNYDWRVKIGKKSISGFDFTYDENPWKNVNRFTTIESTEKMCVEAYINGEWIVFEDIDITSYIDYDTQQYVFQQEGLVDDETRWLNFNSLKVNKSDMLLEMTYTSKEGLKDFSYYGFYLEDDQMNQYHFRNLIFNTDGSIGITFEPSIMYRDVKSLTLCSDSKRYLAIESVEIKEGESFYHNDYRTPMGAVEFTVERVGKEGIMLSTHHVVNNRYFPRISIKENGEWIGLYLQPIFEDDVILETTTDKIKQAFLVTQAQIDAMFPETFVKISKKDLISWLDDIGIVYEAQRVDKLLEAVENFRITRIEVENHLGYSLEEITDREEAIKLLAEYLELNYGFDNGQSFADDLLESLKTNDEMFIGSDTENLFKYGFYSHRYLNNKDNFEFGVVKKVIHEKDNLRIELKIN